MPEFYQISTEYYLNCIYYVVPILLYRESLIFDQPLEYSKILPKYVNSLQQAQYCILKLSFKYQTLYTQVMWCKLQHRTRMLLATQPIRLKTKFDQSPQSRVSEYVARSKLKERIQRLIIVYVKTASQYLCQNCDAYTNFVSLIFRFSILCEISSVELLVIRSGHQLREMTIKIHSYLQHVVMNIINKLNLIVFTCFFKIFFRIYPFMEFPYS